MLMSGCEHQTLGVLRPYLCIHVQPDSAPNTKGGSSFHVFMVMIKFIQWSQNPQHSPWSWIFTCKMAGSVVMATRPIWVLSTGTFLQAITYENQSFF